MLEVLRGEGLVSQDLGFWHSHKGSCGNFNGLVGVHTGREQGLGHAKNGVSMRCLNKVVNNKLDNRSEDKDLKIISRV